MTQSTDPRTHYDDEISLYDLYCVLYRRKGWAIGVFLLVVMATATAAIYQTNTFTPEYEATAVLDPGTIDERMTRGELRDYAAQMEVRLQSKITEDNGMLHVTMRAQDPVAAEQSARQVLQSLHQNRSAHFQETRGNLQERTRLLQDNVRRNHEMLADLQARESSDNELEQTLTLLLQDSLRLRLADGEHRLAETQRELAQLNTTQPEILQPATAGATPVNQPNTQLMFALGIVLGLMLGLFAAFLTEFFTNAHRKLRADL